MLNEEKRNRTKMVFQEQMNSFLEKRYNSHNCIQEVYTLANFFCVQQVKTETGKELFILFQKNIQTDTTNVFLQIKKINT